MQSSVISFTETEFEAAIACAKSRLVIVTPGFSVKTARALAAKWRELGANSVQVVLDLDPETCRLGYGEGAALEVLQQTAEELGTQLHQQAGLRIGLLISDETTTIFSPTPLLIEAGGRPGERSSAIRLGTPLLDTQSALRSASASSINLAPTPIVRSDIQETCDSLIADPPLKFDVSRKINVFNAKFEFVEFEMRGLAIARKKASIPSDLLGLGRDPNIQKLLQSTFQLIEEGGLLSGERVSKLKQAIIKKYLRVLPGYGTVVLRPNKAAFQASIIGLERYIRCFKKTVRDSLQDSMNTNMEKLLSALLPSVVTNQPKRWRSLGENLGAAEVERLLRADLRQAFGTADSLFEEMSVKVVFKGVTYELLSDPAFMSVAQKALPHLRLLHDEFEAAKAEQLDVRDDLCSQT